MKTLRDVLPQEFFREFMDTPAARLLDREVTATHESGDPTRSPFTHRHVYVWWEVQGGKAVAWNENPARGWSFPVAAYVPPPRKTSDKSAPAREAARPKQNSRPGALRISGHCACGLRMIADMVQDGTLTEHPFYYFERDGTSPEGWSDICPRCGVDHYADYCAALAALIGVE
jgi:hypothetical protein